MNNNVANVAGSMFEGRFNGHGVNNTCPAINPFPAEYMFDTTRNNIQENMARINNPDTTMTRERCLDFHQSLLTENRNLARIFTTNARIDSVLNSVNNAWLTTFMRPMNREIGRHYMNTSLGHTISIL